MIKTAEEFLKGKPFSIESINQHMIEFAKLHCIEQAKVISEKAEIEERNYLKTPMKAENYGQEVQSEHEGIYYGVDKNSILNAYNLNNIK